MPWGHTATTRLPATKNNRILPSSAPLSSTPVILNTSGLNDCPFPLPCHVSATQSKSSAAISATSVSVPDSILSRAAAWAAAGLMEGAMTRKQATRTGDSRM
jgi:hypothetical protein